MQTRSLGFYVRQMKRGRENRWTAMSADDCLNAADHYHEFLAPYEAEILQIAEDGDRQILPLAEINLPAEAYIQIVDQVYAGISVDQLMIPYPAPAHINAPEDPNNNCFTRYIDTLHDDHDRTRTDVTGIMDRTNAILAERTAGEQRISGLVVGRVQSGKTRNYIGLMLKAVSEGWNVIIILTSNNRALGRQTQDRVRKDMGKAGADRGIYIDFMNHAHHGAGNIQQGQFFWGVEIKQQAHLDGIIQWFRDNENYQPDMRVLVIDDEADNASPEARIGQGLWNDATVENKINIIAARDAVLASWFCQISDTVLSEVQEEHLDILLANGTEGQKQERLLGDTVLADPLFLNNFRDENERVIDIRNEINLFFDRANAPGEEEIRCHRTFIKLIRSIFAIAKSSSAINSRIRQIIDRHAGAAAYEFNFAQCAYVGYTATPYACIFNRLPGETPLFPDFIYSLTKSPEHFGLQEIFGSDLTVAQPRMNIVTVLTNETQFICDNLQSAILTENLPADDNQRNAAGAAVAGFYLNPATLEYCYIPANADENGDAEENEEDNAEVRRGVWTTLKKAIAWAFCTAAARRWCHYEDEGDNPADDQKKGSRDDCWTTMILNLSQLQEFHQTLQNLVTQYIHHQLTDAGRPRFLNECRTAWEEQTAQFTEQNFNDLFRRNQTPYPHDPTPYPEWDNIAEELNNHFFEPANYRVIQINSTNEGKTGQTAYWDELEGETIEAADHRRWTNNHDKLWIICGGNTISRGLTLSGLTVSYFDRVSDTTAVDTFTQMGRWFGYRRGYELLPRIWMPADTINEYKRAAFCEEKMHADLEDAFKGGKRPSDGENFVTFYCWGRKLSLHADMIRRLTASISMTASSNWISTKPTDVQNVLVTVRNFLSPRTEYLMNNANSKFPNHAVWTNIPAEDIVQLLNNLLNSYPEETKGMFRGLITEIQRQPIPWDIVSGAETAMPNEPGGVELCNAIRVNPGHPTGVCAGDAAKFNGARTINSFYAMIDSSVINRVDCRFLEEAKKPILAAIQKKIDAAPNHRIPPSLDREFPEGDNLETRFDRLIEQLEADYTVSMSNTIHGLLRGNSTLDGYRNRSNHDYQVAAYQAAGHNRPTLQIYLINPPAEAHLNIPLVSVSFFWPDHEPDLFFQIATGLPQGVATRIPATLTELFAAIREVLEENVFPLRVRRLKAEITINKLQGRCSEAFFTQNIMRGAEQSLGYRRFPGKDAYYPLTWATSDDAAIRKRDEEFFQAAYQILVDRGTPIAAQDLYNEVANSARFSGFSVNNVTNFNQLFTDERLHQLNITRTRPNHRITYQYTPEQEEN